MQTEQKQMLTVSGPKLQRLSSVFETQVLPSNGGSVLALQLEQILQIPEWANAVASTASSFRVSNVRRDLFI